MRTLFWISDSTIDFLDLQIHLEDGHLRTSLFRKQTAANSLLHFDSFHPAHLRTGIPKGQFLRIRRNCTSMLDFNAASQDLTSRFRARRYPKKVIAHAYETAKKADRQELFIPRTRTHNSRVQLITKYNNQWQDLYRLLHTHWYLLMSDSKIRDYITPSPKMIARRAPNLKDKLIYYKDLAWSIYQLSHSKCGVCVNLQM